MPIDPKQQPPYYRPGIQGTIDNKYQRLNAQYNVVQTSGTSETDLYLYTIPANTLTNNGDSLKINLSLILSVSGTNNNVRYYLDGTLQHGETSDSLTIITWEIDMIRISTTQVQQTIRQRYADGTGFQEYQTQGTLDFTNTIPIRFTGQCDNPGQLQTYYITIDKITI